MSAVVAVCGMGLWLEGYPNLSAYLAGTQSAGASPSGALLDKHSRRRASDFTKALADVYAEALSAAALPADTVASVFGSALGEVGTMISLLDQMWREGGALSPMRFAGSVHNAAAGVVSIGTKNTGFTTSIGADHDTPAMALFEAIAIVKSRAEPVMVACGDEAAPSDLVGGAFGWGSLCAAIALLPADHADPALPRLTAPEIREPTLAPSEVPPGIEHNPEVGMLDLITSLARGASGAVRLDRGRGRGYCVEISRTP